MLSFHPKAKIGNTEHFDADNPNIQEPTVNKTLLRINCPISVLDFKPSSETSQMQNREQTSPRGDKAPPSPCQGEFTSALLLFWDLCGEDNPKISPNGSPPI